MYLQSDLYHYIQRTDQVIKCFILLVKISTSETEAFVLRSVDLNMLCPSKAKGLPEIASTTTVSLLMYSAEDGFTSLIQDQCCCFYTMQNFEEDFD